MDLARSWAWGSLASAATFLIVVGVPGFRGFPLLQLLVPFTGGLVASAVHPPPHRERLGRHATAVVPPGMALPVLGTVLAWRGEADIEPGAMWLTLVLALLVVLLAAALMASARRRIGPDRSRRRPP